MDLNLLLLPLLGGYYFVTTWNHTRYPSLRESGERLVYRSAFVAVCFAFLGRLCIEVLNRCCAAVGTTWKMLVPFDYFGTACLAFLTAIVLPHVLNFVGDREWRYRPKWLPSRDEAVRRAIQDTNDNFEQLLFQAMEESVQVEVTLKSQKVYIGSVLQNINPAHPRKWVLLLPTMSGYRTPDRMKIELTTNYARVYKKMQDGDPLLAHLEREHFNVCFPVDEIQSARIFDINAFEEFQRLSDSTNSIAIADLAD